jgi:arginase
MTLAPVGRAPLSPEVGDNALVGRAVGVIGVPTSAGAFAPGQERAPSALRQAGLLSELTAAGLDVHDHGDRETWRWRPDRTTPRSQNATKVVEIVRDTARRVDEAQAAGELTLILGGDCTVGIGTVAGHLAAGERLGLVYFDQHADLNVPESVPEGALDWMGMAHMLGVDGAVPELVACGPRTPMLAPEQVLLFGWGGAGDHLRATGDRRPAHRRDPGRASRRRPGGGGGRCP